VLLHGWAAKLGCLTSVRGETAQATEAVLIEHMFCTMLQCTPLQFPAGDEAAVRKKADDPQPEGACKAAPGRQPGNVVVTEGTLPRATIIREHLKLLLLYNLVLAGVAAALQYSSTGGLPRWAVQALYGIGACGLHYLLEFHLS
jgi:hypothetical protein